jgi:hypothetical protein
LNLSRNRYFKFHSELCDPTEDFIQLQELDFSFNLVEEEQGLWFLTQTKSINLVNITGNPFAQITTKQHNYPNLEYELQKNLSAVIINDTHLIDERKLYKRKTPKQHLPYPNPIKLQSRETSKEIKGDYLNAEVMRKGIALPISDIRPNTNIQSEIFPRELTKEAQSKDVFTPPNHQQMRFVEGDGDDLGHQEDAGNFFITGADVKDQ